MVDVTDRSFSLVIQRYYINLFTPTPFKRLFTHCQSSFVSLLTVILYQSLQSTLISTLYTVIFHVSLLPYFLSIATPPSFINLFTQSCFVVPCLFTRPPLISVYTWLSFISFFTQQSFVSLFTQQSFISLLYTVVLLWSLYTVPLYTVVFRRSLYAIVRRRSLLHSRPSLISLLSPFVVLFTK